MRIIGVFGLNLSEKSGGTYHLFEELMQNASFSNNKYLYITEKTSIEVFPSNVEAVLRPKLFRIFAQALPILPLMDLLYGNEAMSECLIKALVGCRTSQVDAWLWPHCFSIVPNMNNIGVICHDMIHKHYPEYFNSAPLARREKGEKSLKHVDAILCPSYHTQNDLLSIYPELKQKTRVFPETACEILSEKECADEIKSINTKFASMPLFLFVGVDWPHKNHELLFDAAKKLSIMTKNPFKVIFIGYRRSSCISGMIKERQMQDYVIDVGTVSRRELAAYYFASRALLFPSLYEGFGIPLVEAFHYKLPIVASNQSCIPEICGEAAILLPPDDPDIWARHMYDLLDDNNILYSKYSQLSYLRSSKFSWQKTWKALDHAFEELIL